MSTRRQFIQRTTATALTASFLEVAQTKQPKPKKGKSGILRLAIVGTGDISHRYLKQAAISEKAHIVATCARHLDGAKARAEEYQIGAWFDDYNAMYEAIKPDGVIIATPNSVHAAPSIAALERGIAVLCEKPMATSWEDCRAMLAAAQKSNTVFLSLPYDAHQDFLAALEHLNESTLGAFTGAEAQLLIPQPGRDNWYYDHAVAGGAMLDSLVYPVSRLIGLLGPAQRVTGFVNTLIPQRALGDGNTVDLVPPIATATSKAVKSNVDDNVSLVAEWNSGQQAIFRTLWGTSFVRNDTAIYGRKGTLWLCTNGDVIIHSPLQPVSGADPLTWNGIANCYRVPYKPMQDIAHEGLVDHFADCIQGRSQPTCGGPQQLHVHEILFKGYEAARTGSVLTLETTFTPWHSIDPSFYDTRSRVI